MIFLIFFVNLFEMIYELVASRAIAPYYGNGNYTMTAIIAVMLLSGSLGNMIGGKLTRSDNKYTTVGFLFLLSTVVLSFSLSSIPYMYSFLNSVFTDIRISISIYALMFFVPALVMGIFTPIAMDDILQKYPKERIGEINGRIHAVIAIGSLGGTVLGGFVLIPAMGTNTIFAVIMCFMLFVGLFYEMLYMKDHKDRFNIARIVVIVLLCIAFTAHQFIDLQKTKVFAGDYSNEMSFDTAYGRILVYDYVNDNGDSVRMYRMGDSYASATYLDDDKKYDPVFPYIKTYDYAQEYLDVKNALMIGAAAYQYPKHFISSYTDESMDVVEINGESTDIAMKYFFLDDLINEYGSERLNCITADGRVYMNQTEKVYDTILCDCFSGGSPVGTLCTVEFCRLLKSKLTPDGVYMANCIGPLVGEHGLFIRSEAKTLSQVFRYVYALPTVSENKIEDCHNWMLVATDNPYRPDIAFDITFGDDDYILTDDFCPAEALGSYKINKGMDGH